MYIQFLGTNAGLPGKFKNPSSLILDLTEEVRGGETIMVDCGEGAQIQLIRQGDKIQNGSKPSVSKINKIFITHLHLDHILGLPGVISTAGSQGRTEPLDIYAPKGLKEWVLATLKMTKNYSSYKLNFHEVNVGDVYIFNDYKVEVYGLKHDVSSYGYHFIMNDREGSLDGKKAMKLGAKGKDLGLLKSGLNVTLDDGTVIKSSEVVGDKIKGKQVMICGDTKFLDSYYDVFPKNLDALVFEGTLDKDDTDDALSKYMHSTFQNAAHLGKEIKSKNTFINHLSSRYLDMKEVNRKIKEINENAQVVKDFDSFKI